MAFQSDRLHDLILGVERSRSRRALALGGVFLIAGLTLEYLLFVTKFENGVVEVLHEVFLLNEYVPNWHATGAFFVIGLAALHAYLNEGYLPSVLLGWSLVYGNVIWTIGSLQRIENYYLDPVAAFGRTFPEAVVLATLGFVIGIGLRQARKRRRDHAIPQSDQAEAHSTG
ncbi:hypothetical protein [Halorussus sp. MSC15.2]|uniref:hypothetical protein n=1 Tax=Halorussus sp. MSC15.2 TaxID=2283638 RepID=UPI0013D3660E|nr:hypothetical protein [Halorussus sp. MSC15.2]NEU56416.1 hypothetical protein [Halorussus sp. MSC15.2]